MAFNYLRRNHSCLGPCSSSTAFFLIKHSLLEFVNITSCIFVVSIALYCLLRIASRPLYRPRRVLMSVSSLATTFCFMLHASCLIILLSFDVCPQDACISLHRALVGLLMSLTLDRHWLDRSIAPGASP
ncbi:hypothetical protein DFH29DRAFT_929601 [Suillus ampliporus]|nr:hypothetical protein DFH29DRAFT_929601 [Suillus ampliporus]